MKTLTYNNIYEEMLAKTELSSIDKNRRISESVLKEILAYTNMNVFFGPNIKTTEDKLFELKYQKLYGSKYQDKLFKILKKYGYDTRKEIKDAMIHLSHLKDPTKNEAMIKTFLNSPVIQDITFDGKDSFTIYSDAYGVFPFYLANYYFKDNDQITEYIKKGTTRSQCHANTFFLSAVLEKGYAITSLCPFEFRGSYHHSYTYDSETDNIIDLSRNTIMKRNDYESLLQPQEVSTIQNKNVLSEAYTTLEKAGPSKWCAVIKIALYKEYLTQIGYQGTLEDAPYVKQKYNDKNKKI